MPRSVWSEDRAADEEPGVAELGSPVEEYRALRVYFVVVNTVIALVVVLPAASALVTVYS